MLNESTQQNRWKTSWYWTKSIIKQVLYPQNGYVSSGQALYIMGASGAGKTSLLNALWDRTQHEGDVLLNKRVNITKENYGTFGVYVTQDDVLYPTLTWYESLMFACRLKLNLTYKKAKYRVDDLIKQLGLNKWQNTLIGNNLIRGLSGGERKRTAIGVELISEPSVLLLDEPTSGLDSFNALKIVKILNKQVKKGRIVISTIHQPSSACFDRFDKLLLLMEGHCIYQGKAWDAADYFSKIGYAWPQNYNPPDYFLRVFNRDKSKEEIDALSYQYKSGSEKSLLREFQNESMPMITEELLVETVAKSQNWWHEFALVFERSFRDSYRNPLYLRSRFIIVLWVALLTLSVFHDLGYSDTDAKSKAGFIFFSWTNQVMLNFYGTVLSIIREKRILEKEYHSQTYGVIPYYCAKMWIELPFTILYGIMFSLINYFGVGLDESFDKFSLFIFGITLLVLSSTALGVAVGTIFDSERTAIAWGGLFLGPIMLFSGFIVNLEQVYVWIRWLEYFSPVRYAAEVLLRNEFEDNPKYRFNPMDTYSLDFGTTNCLIMLILMTFGLRAISIIALKRSVK